MSDEEHVVYIEYDSDGRPFSVVTEEQPGYSSYYDFEWCKRDRCLYHHLSGCGPTPTFEPARGCSWEVLFWAADHIAVELGPLAKRIASPLPEHPIDSLLEDGDSYCEYCSVCDDHLPTSWQDHPCDHVWYCEEYAHWSKPGERCVAGCIECIAGGRPTRSEGEPLLLIAEGYGWNVEGYDPDNDRCLCQWPYSDIVDGYWRAAREADYARQRERRLRDRAYR